MTDQPRPRTDRHYTYRRELSLEELLPAVGVGIGIGALAFYVAKLFIERTPLEGGAGAAWRSERARGEMSASGSTDPDERSARGRRA